MIQAGRDGGRYRNDPTARTPDELAAATTKPELGVEAMSLYTHVRNKDDLLDSMVDAVISQIPMSADRVDWKTSVRDPETAASLASQLGPTLPHVAEMALAATRTGALGRATMMPSSRSHSTSSSTAWPDFRAADGASPSPSSTR